MYCRRCQYELRGCADACPECGKVFSPDDPATFQRTRPGNRKALRTAVFIAALASWLIPGLSMARDPHIYIDRGNGPVVYATLGPGEQLILVAIAGTLLSTILIPLAWLAWWVFSAWTARKNHRT